MPVRVNIKSWSGLCCFSQRVTWSKPLVAPLGMHIVAVTVELIVTIVMPQVVNHIPEYTVKQAWSKDMPYRCFA